MAALMEAIRALLMLLHDGELSTFDVLTGGGRLNAADVSRAVQEYGRKLAPPPADLAPFVTEVGDKSGTLHISVPFWTSEEGRSDLEMRLVAREVSPGLWELQVDDVLVP
jgi:hypothetical protein